MVCRTIFRLVIVAVVMMLMATMVLAGVPKTLTQQGRLTNTSGTALDGFFDIEYRIYANPSPPGSALWTELHSGVHVINGLFTVNLGTTVPIDPTLFDGSPRYLGIKVGTDPEISPRTLMGAAPYAIHAESMPGFTPGPGNNVMGDFSFAAGDSNRVVDDYSSIGGGEHNEIEILNFADTIPDTNISPMAGLPYDPAADKSSHFVFTAFIGGGLLNHAHGIFSGVLGGFRDSAAAALSTIGCGFNNITHATAMYGVIGGGFQNSTRGGYSTIGGGQLNQHLIGAAPYLGETIGGGMLNTTNQHVTTIGGGMRNFAGGFASSIGGGFVNNATGNYATIAGGQDNSAPGPRALVGGGQGNSSSAPFSAIGGGQANVSSASHAYVGGGANNTAGGDSSVVGGGIFNAAIGFTSTIAGGGKNGAFGNLSAIGGGNSNSTSADFTVVAGGTSNVASGISGAVGGGVGNVAGPGSNSTVPGGFNNVASGDNSFAAGTFANAVDTCSFVWADCCRNSAGLVSPLYSTGFNSWTARATGGFYLLTGCDSVYNAAFPGTSGVYVPAGGSSWLSGSHSSLKENIVPVDGEDLLDKLDGLDIKRWNYRAQDPSIEHIGPMAEDFYATFGVGDNAFTLSSIDPAGIALAAVKELHKKTKQLEEQSRKIDELEARLDKLTQIVESSSKEK